MKILQVFDWFSPLHGGGTVDLMYEYSKGLIDRGHEVSILATDFERDEEYIRSLKGAHVYLCHALIGKGGIFVAPEMGNFPVWDYDVVHFQLYRSYNNVLLVRQCRKHEVPYIFDAHGSCPRMQGMKAGLKWAYDALWGFNDLKRAALCIAQTPIGVKEYQALGVPLEKIVRINPPLDVKPYEYLPPKGLFKEKYGLKDKRIVIYMGRMAWVKGLDFLVESFKLLRQFRQDVVLVMMGAGGDYWDGVHKLVAQLGLTEHVVFTGFLAGQEKMSALQDADVIVQPSRYEQGVRPLFEALLCNTPGICTKHTGAGEQVAEFKAGALVTFGDKRELASMMNAALEWRDEKWIAEAKQRIMSLSLENHVQEFEKIYDRVIDGCDNSSRRWNNG